MGGSGEALPSGAVGEEVTGTVVGNFAVTNGVVHTVGEITLQPGIYVILARSYASPNGSNIVTLFRTSISLSDQGLDLLNYVSGSDGNTASADTAHNDFRVVRVTSTTTYYSRMQVGYTGASPTNFIQDYSYMKAYRIA